MKKKILSGVVMSLTVFLLMFSLCACGAGGSKSNNATAPSVAADAGGSYGMYDSDRNTMPAPQAAPTEMEMDYNYAVADDVFMETGMGGGFSDEAARVNEGRKITYSADLSLNTKTFDADYARINDLIIMSGGYISSERTVDNSTASGRTTGRSSYFSIRVPADGYSSCVDALCEIGELVDKHKSTDDLTSQYFDNEARIEMLEIRKERLMKYLVEAEDASDIVEFERELSYVLYDLDMYKGDKRWMDQLVDFSTINISLNELITPETIGKDGEPLGDRASDAFSLSMTGVGRFLEGCAVFFAGAAPVIGLLVIIAAIVWAFMRFTRPLREKLRAKRMVRAEQAAQRRAALMEAEMRKRAAAAEQKGMGKAYNAYPQPGQYPPPPPGYQPQAQPAAPPVGQTPPAGQTPEMAEGSDAPSDAPKKK